MSKSPSLTVGAPTAARVLGLSRRQFDRLAKAGVLPQHEPRRFDLVQVVPAFCKYIEQGREGVTTLAEAKLSIAREQARKLALANDLRAGRQVPVEGVTEMLSDLTHMMVATIDSIPGRHADELARIDDTAVMLVRLKDIARDVRQRWSDGCAALADRYGTPPE